MFVSLCLLSFLEGRFKSREGRLGSCYASWGSFRVSIWRVVVDRNRKCRARTKIHMRTCERGISSGPSWDNLPLVPQQYRPVLQNDRHLWGLQHSLNPRVENYAIDSRSTIRHVLDASLLTFHVFINLRRPLWKMLSQLVSIRIKNFRNWISHRLKLDSKRPSSKVFQDNGLDYARKLHAASGFIYSFNDDTYGSDLNQLDQSKSSSDFLNTCSLL